MSLTELLQSVRDYAGLHQKQEIQLVQQHLSEGFPPPFPNGDDAAVIPNGDQFDLLAGVAGPLPSSTRSGAATTR